MFPLNGREDATRSSGGTLFVFFFIYHSLPEFRGGGRKWGSSEDGGSRAMVGGRSREKLFGWTIELGNLFIYLSFPPEYSTSNITV